MMCANFAHLFSEKSDVFSRVIVDGIDAFLKQLLWDVYEDINQGFAFIIKDLDKYGDKNAWKEIFNNRHKYNIAVVILFRTLLYFENMETSRKSFIARVNSIVGDRRFLFDTNKFNVIFLALYSDLFDRIGDEGWSREIDVVLGDGTAKRVEKIRQEFSKSLKSAEGSSSTAERPGKRRQPKEQKAQLDKSKRILVIDDEPEVQDLISETLTAEGYQVAMAGMMEEAEKHLGQGGPDLVIIDIFMPGIGGIKGIQAIRQNNREVGIIAISGGWGDTTAAQSTDAARTLGADFTLQKPFDLDELIRHVQNLIGPA